MIHSHWQDIPHQFLTQAMTNSSLNIQLMKCNKRHLLSQKERRRAAFAVQKDDILDLVSKAWDESFAHIATNQKAVAEQGWGPLNYNFLLNLGIQLTSTSNLQTEANNDQPASLFHSPIRNKLEPRHQWNPSC